MSAEDRKEITRLINEWNSSRYELFALSQPNERLEFHGVMRFYFQDTGEKVSTKCVRVESTATTEDVVKVLIEKFRPDMKSLSVPKDYSIYEVHSDSQERKLDRNERPLWIQLEWGKEGREGRFLLKNDNVKTFHVDPAVANEGLLRDKKRLSKREKKKLQQQEKQIQSGTQTQKIKEKEQKGKVAEHLYKEVPDSNFTRSISNPEIVMARRRQQKLENKLKQIKNKDGGGTLKVYGETLKPDIPYKTLLLSNNDTAAFAVKETLDKYGLSSEDPDNYCLVQVVTPSREDRDKHGAQIKEYILEDNALPLAILMKHPTTAGSIIFQIRRCTPDILALRKKKKQEQSTLEQQQQQQQQGMMEQKQQRMAQMVSQPNLQTQNMLAHQEANKMINTSVSSKLPFLVELTHEGFDLASPRIIQIKSDFYEVGNDKFIASTHPTNYIRIDPSIPHIEKKHCAIKKSNDNFQVLVIPYAETYVNDRIIEEPTQMFNGFTLRLGKYCLFRLENPNETVVMNGINNQMVKQNDIQSQPQNNSMVANYGLLYDSGEVTETNAQPLHSQSMSNIQQRSVKNQVMNVPALKPQVSTVSNQQSGGNSVVNGGGGESGLPGLLEFSDDSEDLLLQNICSQRIWESFRLAPVYTMYMMLRFRLSQKYKPDYSFGDKLHSLGMLIHKMVNYVREAVDQAHADKQLLPYWLANSSELLYFFKQDVHLSQQSIDAQEALAECVQIAFKYLVNLMQQQLERVLIAFFDPSDLVDDVEYDGASANVNGLQSDTINSRPTLKSVIQVLNETMYLMRSSRVNAALTIQLFSQLFHYISMSLFNRLVKDQRCTGLCSRYWGEKLSRRLSKIQVWAEKQGLELAADCHLQRIIQAAYLLQAPKHDIQQLSAISSNCFTLNSAQIKCLLKNYLLSNQEPPLSAQLCNNLIAIAQNTADDVLKQDGRMVQVEEEIDLQLPFMLPEDGHSSEMIKGLCKGFLDFLEILQNTGHCWLWQNTQGPGNWKKFFNKEQQVANNASQFVQSELPKSQSASHINQQQQQQQQQQPPVTTPTTNPTHFQSPIAANNVANQLQQVVQNAPKVIKMKLEKKNNGLGLSIVAARGSNNMTGIYIKSVVPGGAASDDGRLSAGDQLLAVDDHSLINVTQERAAELMCKSGPWVMLTVAKDAASYHNLDAILSKSPLPPPSTQSASQLPSTSMPALNQQFNGFQQPLQNISNTAQTLPRSHHLINNNAQQDAIHLPLQSSALIEQQQSGEVPTFKTRSMSQDLLRNNLVNSPIQQIQQIQPQMNQEMIQFQNQQLQRPTTITSPNSQQFQQFGYPVRSLPNEQQIRYGSERPMSIHQQQQQQQQQLPFQQQPTSQVDSRYAPPTQMAQRTLPNEFLPRFGSERPSSSNLHTQYNPPINNRLHSVNESLSPIKPQTQLRQASLSELDEINYNTNKQLMAEYQQKQQQQQQQNTNRIEDLYGKVNPNRYGNNSKSNPSLDAAVNQQYKTLPNRSANPTMNQVASNSNQLNVEEPQRAKSYGQLYEQIWSNNNGVQQQQPQIMPGQLANINQMNRQQFHSSHPSQMSLPIDEMKQLELNGVGQNRVPPPRSYQPPQQIQQQQQQQQQQAMMRNYENQMVNNNNGHRAGPPVMAKPALPPNKPTQLKINREQNDEESRMEMLKKRIEMLNELEGKAYRSNEEENMLNKLRTEIEFDKRVIEMSVGQGSYGDENNEENDVEYAPEVRERIANEYFQRRKKFDEILSHSHSGSVEIVDMPSHFNGLETSASDNKLSHHHHELMMNEEADRLMEARREETRLKKHVEMSHTRSHASLSNSSSSNSYHMSAFVESEPLELQRPTLQQKHVQFMTDHGSSPSTPSRQPPPPSQLQQVTTQSFQAMKQPQQPTSSSSSSDQLDSSPSTPPPIPPLSTQPQPKRVMFSDTSKLLEFEQDHFTGGKTVDTPSVIGANEIYVDQRLKIKQQQQQQMAQMVIEGEKLSFKDKMRLFARQSGENTNGLSDSENRLKVSRKQREIESKFESK